MGNQHESSNNLCLCFRGLGCVATGAHGFHVGKPDQKEGDPLSREGRPCCTVDRAYLVSRHLDYSATQIIEEECGKK